MKKDHILEDVKAWRELSQRHMPDWQPTLQKLRRLDEGPTELLRALRSVARGWSPSDARWDVLMAVVEYYKRQHAHELAEKQRARADQSAMMRSERMQGIAQGLRLGAIMIDPEALSDGG